MSPLRLPSRVLQAQPDTRLVALAREGYEPAFEALVRRYRRELLSYCRKLQPQSGNAEDALQQTLLQAWRALSGGAEIRDVRPWLYRIAHNVAVSNLRVAVAVPHDVEETAGAADVEQLVEQRLQAHAALAGVASLPPLQRQVMVSTALDGASHEEVASTLGLSSASVRGLIYRARATLRAAAAAITPAPALSWALRSADGGGGPSGIVEAAATGGGAGVAGLLVKGGAVLTLAGAVAGGGILSHGSDHGGKGHVPLVAPAADGARGVGSAAAALRSVAAAPSQRGGDAAPRVSGPRQPNGASGSDGGHGRDGGSTQVEASGSSGSPGEGTSGVSDDGSSSGSSGGSPGGASATSGSSGGGSSPSVSSGSDGGSSGGGPGPSSGSQPTAAVATSSPDGGSAGAPDGSGSSGTSITTTTSTTSGPH